MDPIQEPALGPPETVRRDDVHLSAGRHVYCVVNIRPEGGFDMHVHPGLEFGVILSGEQERHYQGHVTRLSAGQVWFCASWEPHGWRFTAPSSTDVVVQCLPVFLGEATVGPLSWMTIFAVPPHDRPRAATPEVQAEMVRFGDEVIREAVEQQPGWEEMVRLAVLRALLVLAREWSPPAQYRRQGEMRPLNLVRIMPALALANSAPARRVRVQEAAAACRLSRAQFCLLFRRTMGLSFGQFELRARLAAAAQTLLSTRDPVEAVARAAGFVDGSHLNRVFLRHYGCTPARYREQGGPRGEVALTAPGPRAR